MSQNETRRPGNVNAYPEGNDLVLTDSSEGLEHVQWMAMDKEHVVMNVEEMA